MNEFNTSRKGKKRPQLGDVFEADLGDNKYAYFQYVRDDEPYDGLCLHFPGVFDHHLSEAELAVLVEDTSSWMFSIYMSASTLNLPILPISIVGSADIPKKSLGFIPSKDIWNKADKIWHIEEATGVRKVHDAYLTEEEKDYYQPGFLNGPALKTLLSYSSWRPHLMISGNRL